MSDDEQRLKPKVLDVLITLQMVQTTIRKRWALGVWKHGRWHSYRRRFHRIVVWTICIWWGIAQNSMPSTNPPEFDNLL
jgi:hypothetical protein